MIGAAKLVSAAVILLFAMRRDKTAPNTLLLAIVLALAIVGLWQASTAAFMFLCLCVLEVTLNLASARLQGALAAASPKTGSAWLGTAILVGIIIGAPLHGLAMSIPNGGTIFMVFVIVTCFIPWLWLLILQHRAVAG